MAEVLFQGRKLEDLKVMEIKEELGRRGLNKKGIKAVLTKRLEAALLKEQNEKEEVTLDVSMDTAGSDYSNRGIANDVLSGTELEKVAGSQDGDDKLAPSQELDCEHDEEEASKEHLVEGVEEYATDDGENAEETMETHEDWSQEAGDTESCGSHNVDVLSSSIELANVHEEELIYEGDQETDIVKDVEQAPDAKGDDTGDEVIFDLSKEVGFSLDSTDNEQKTFSGDKFADKNAKRKEESSTNGKPASGEKTSRCSSLWVSGLVVSVSAADLKTLFSPFGQVISAKVVVRARSKNHRYGYVTMATPEQAEKSIKALHNTELKGWKISVDLAKSSDPKTVAGSTREGATDVSALPEEEKVSAKVQQESRNGTSGSTTPVKGGCETDPQTEEPSKADTVSDAPNTTAGHDGSNRGSNSQVANKADQPASSGSASGRRIIMVKKGDGKKELVRVGSAYGKARSPLLRMHPRSLSPPRNLPHGYGRPKRGMIMSRLSPPRSRGDVRHDLLRGRMEHRSIHSRLGRYVDPMAMEMQLHEERQRMLYERDMEREHLRRELEMEQHHKEQMFVRQMEEVRAREAQRRGIFEQKQREAVERERLFHQREQQIRQKEQMLQERERREQERLEALEKQKEREYRERERRYREQLEKELQEKEAKLQKERELRERQLRLQEQELQAKQNRLMEEQEMQAKLVEQERRERERRRRLHEEEIRAQREQPHDPDRNEKSAIKRPFSGEQAEIPAKRQSFSPDADSRASYAPFARTQQGGIASDNIRGSLLGRYDLTERAGGRPVISPYAYNQNKPREGQTAYSRNAPIQDQSGVSGFGYGSRGSSSLSGGKMTSPGYGFPYEGAKQRSPFGSLGSELMAVPSHSLSPNASGGSFERTKSLGSINVRDIHSHLPELTERNLGSTGSGRSPSEMVSYPSIFGQNRMLPQPSYPRGGYHPTRGPAYRNLSGDSWYDQGAYPSMRGGGYRRM